MAEEITPQGTPQKEVQQKVMMIIICCLLGEFGIHRLMMGYSNWWVQLITLGGCGIWVIYDLIMLIMDKMPMADGRPLAE